MKAVIAIANGCEEMEAVIVADVLRRAGVDVVLASIEETLNISASRGVKLIADALWDHVQMDADILILPGGMDGMKALRGDPRIIEQVKTRYRDGQWIGAICAAPLVLQTAGVLEGLSFTAHPGVKEQFTTGVYNECPVVIDGNVITSQGPGTAMAFALTIIEQLADKEKADAVSAGLMLMGSR